MTMSKSTISAGQTWSTVRNAINSNFTEVYSNDYGNCYSPSALAVDQGVTGDNNTIKYFVDLIGSDIATILLKHDSGEVTTTYTLTTSETLPANIALKVEPGAIIGGTGVLSGNLDEANVNWFAHNSIPGTTDMTSAFNAAQRVSKNIIIPAGSYGLSGVRIQQGTVFKTSGRQNTIFYQLTENTPVINCISDVTTGQLYNLDISGFHVVGKTGATVAAVYAEALTVYAITNSKFDFYATSTYRPLQVNTGSAIYNCDFKVTSWGSANALLINGGSQNIYDFYISGSASGVALTHLGGFGDCFNRLITDGQIYSSGNNTVFNNTVVEEIYGSTLVGTGMEAAIYMNGFSQILIGATVNMSVESAAKMTYAFRPFSSTVFISPRIIGAGIITHPVSPSGLSLPFTIISPGQNSAANTMEAIFTDTTIASYSMGLVNLISDCSAWASTYTPQGGSKIQYLAPSNNFNQTLKNTSEVILWDFTGTIALANINLPYFPKNNQVIKFRSQGTITDLNLVSPDNDDITLLPTTISAGGSFSIIFYEDGNKWFLL